MSTVRTQPINPLRHALQTQEVLFGAMLNTPSPALVELCGLLGFDWIFVDGEHEYVDVRLGYELCRAADAVGVPLVIRAQANRKDVLLSFAEAGAHAIVTPGISTGEDAEELVQALSYPPRGHRGLHSRTRTSGYGVDVDPPTYFEAVDTHVMPMAMIENVAAIANLDSIISVENLDLFLVGPGDLSGSLGVPGRIQEQLVIDTVNSAIQKLVEAKKTVGVLASTPESSADYVRRGVRMPMCSTGALTSKAFKGFLAETQDRILDQQSDPLVEGVHA